MTRLTFIRHGESNVSVERRVGGWRTCSGLSPLGHRQAAALAERLARSNELSADALVTSQFPRAIETAAPLHDVFGLTPVVIDGFGEHDPGPELDGKPWAEAARHMEHADWAGNPYLNGFPGGESIAAFHFRVSDTLSRFLADDRGKSLVIVCHGGVVDVAFRHLMRMPMTGGFHLHTLNTSITEFTLDDASTTWKLVRYNDIAHLEGLPAST